MGQTKGYVFAKIVPGRNACRLKSLEGLQDDYELDKGIALKKRFPANASFRMNDKFPNDLKLEDFTWNPNKVLVVSERVCEILDANHLKNNELLPVAIFNHKGRKEKASYFILNQLVHQDCIDLGKSVVVMNNIDPQLISTVKKLVIDEVRIDPEMLIFRLAKHPFVPFFRSDCAAKLKAAGVTGINFLEIQQWGA